MTVHTQHSRGHNRWRIAAWSAAAGIMLLPLFAMAVTNDVTWTVFDFALLGALLLAAGLTCELAARRRGDPVYLAAAAVAVAAACLLVIVTGAVGIIGSEDDDANLMYGAVLAVAIAGAVVVRFQAEGMARVLVATALAQVAVAVIALIGGLGSGADDWPLDILGVTALFVAMWLVSAWLFRKAASHAQRR